MCLREGDSVGRRGHSTHLDGPTHVSGLDKFRDDGGLEEHFGLDKGGRLHRSLPPNQRDSSSFAKSNKGGGFGLILICGPIFLKTLFLTYLELILIIGPLLHKNFMLATSRRLHIFARRAMEYARIIASIID